MEKFQVYLYEIYIFTYYCSMKIALVFLTCLALPLIVFFVISYFDVLRDDFADYPSYLQSDVVSKGWAPTFLPLSSRNIRIKRNIDLNSIDMRFQYDIDDIDGIIENCDKVEPAEHSLQFICQHNGSQLSITLDHYPNGGSGRLFTKKL